MKELLDRIDQMIDDCINNSNEETALQLKIVKGNIHTIIEENMPATESVNNIPNQTEESIEDVTNRKTILVVDDSSIVRNYLDKLLKNSYRMDMAVDGSEAMEKLGNMDEENGYDMILLDLMMPNVDGFGVLEFLSKNDINVPVVVISGDNTGETITKAFRYNVVDMIEKPFDSKTIEEKIERIIERG